MDLEQIIGRASEIAVQIKFLASEMEAIEEYVKNHVGKSFSRKLPNGVLVENKERVKGVLVETQKLKNILEQKDVAENKMRAEKGREIYELESSIIKAKQQLFKLRLEYLKDLDSQESEERERIKEEKIKALALTINTNGFFKNLENFQSFSEEYKRTQKLGEYTRTPELIKLYLQHEHKITDDN